MTTAAPRLALLLMLSVVCATPSASQTTRDRSPLADSAAPRILARATAPDRAVWLRDIMRQTHGAQPRRKLDELADSLAARALAQRAPVDSAAESRANAAVMALVLAGTTRISDGVAYAGAADRLIRVHKESPVQRLREVALLQLPQVESDGRGIAYLRTVATSQDPTASAAIMSLIYQADGVSAVGRATEAERAEARGILVALAQGNQVRVPVAAQQLRDWYEARGK